MENQEQQTERIEFLKSKLRLWYKNNKKFFPNIKTTVVKIGWNNKETLIEMEIPMSLIEFFERYMQDEDIKISLKKYQDNLKNEFKEFRTTAEEFFKNENNKTTD